MKAPRVSVVVEDPRWQKEGRQLAGDLRRAAQAALAACGRRGDLSILLADDAKLEALNTRFRGRKKPTNVLSFPAESGAYLGDVALAYGVAAREAAEAAKTIHDHVLHLAIHGVLHLLGYDHETAGQARVMEPLEVAVLAKFGIADPYAAAPAERVRN